MKRILTALLVVALFIGAAGTQAASAAVVFTDTATSPNADAIVRLASLGIITGYGGGLFKPDNNITRTEFAAMIIRSLGLEATAKGITTKPPFSDVGANYKWAYGYISLAAERGIIKGDQGRFRPADNITVGEAVTMIIRALGRDSLVNKDAKWPDGHVAMAQMLGLGNVIDAKADKASRGAIAGYLDAAFWQDIVQVAADGTVTDTHTSFLSLQNARRYEGKVASVSGSPAYLTLTDATVTPADVGAANGSIEVAADATIYGVASLAELADKNVEVLVRDGKAFFVAPVWMAVGEVRTIEQPQVTLTTGNSYTIEDNTPVTFDSWVIGAMKDAWKNVGPGATVQIKFDATGTKVVSFGIIGDLNGSLYWTGSAYYLDTPYGQFPMIPGDPSGLLTSDTKLMLNGEDINETFMRRDVADPDTLVDATLYINAATGKGNLLSVAVYDSQASYYQPLLAVSSNTITVPAGGDDGLYAVTYTVSPDVGVWVDGDWQDLSYLEPGDYVSFRTDGEQVTYIAAEADVDQPQLLESDWINNDTEEFYIFVDEALDPTTVAVTVDGNAYTQIESDLTAAATSNVYWMYYRENLSFDDARQLIMIYPAGGFTDGMHNVTVEGRDFAGNRVSAAANFRIDTVPATATLSTVSQDGKTVKIQFSDDMPAADVEDAAKWVCSAAPGDVKSVVYDENSHIATLTLGLAQPGATITATLEDVAGNSVTVSVILP